MSFVNTEKDNLENVPSGNVVKETDDESGSNTEQVVDVTAFMKLLDKGRDPLSLQEKERHKKSDEWTVMKENKENKKPEGKGKGKSYSRIKIATVEAEGKAVKIDKNDKKSNEIKKEEFVDKVQDVQEASKEKNKEQESVTKYVILLFALCGFVVLGALLMNYVNKEAKVWVDGESKSGQQQKGGKPEVRKIKKFDEEYVLDFLKKK